MHVTNANVAQELLISCVKSDKAVRMTDEQIKCFECTDSEEIDNLIEGKGITFQQNWLMDDSVLCEGMTIRTPLTLTFVLMTRNGFFLRLKADPQQRTILRNHFDIIDKGGK